MVLMASLLLGAGFGGIVWALLATRETVTTATPVAAADPESGSTTPGLAYRALEPALRALAAAARRLSPLGRVDLIRRRIVYAGRERTTSVERMLAFKALAGIAGFFFGATVQPLGLASLPAGLIFAALAAFVPDFYLESKARARQEHIARDLPEALDLLAITVEAGLGLEQAMETVTANLTGPLADELNRLLREIELGVSRREALGNLRDRTDVPELSSFIVALIQADQVGAPIAEVLRVQSAQVRLKRRQRAREKAAQVPVKILFPLIFFVFPTLFVVTVGPGAIRILETIINR